MSGEHLDSSGAAIGGPAEERFIGFEGLSGEEFYCWCKASPLSRTRELRVASGLVATIRFKGLLGARALIRCRFGDMTIDRKTWFFEQPLWILSGGLHAGARFGSKGFLGRSFIEINGGPTYSIAGAGWWEPKVDYLDDNGSAALTLVETRNGFKASFDLSGQNAQYIPCLILVAWHQRFHQDEM